MPDDLRARTIRLAHTNPSLRPHLIPLLKVATYSPGETVVVRQGFKSLRPGDEVEILKVTKGFTMYGPSPEGTLYIVRDPTYGGTFTIPEWVFQSGSPGKPRDPIEEALSYIQKSLRAAKLLAPFKRKTTVRRHGRRLEVPIGAADAPDPQDVMDALIRHPAITPDGPKRATLKVRVGETEYTTFGIDVATLGGKVHYVEMVPHGGSF